MQTFFAKPTPEGIAEYIYNQVILVHETGGRTYRYKIPHGLTLSFVNEVIDRLYEFLHDAESIQLSNGAILIDWS